MAENLKVKRREKLGGGNNRRLRRTGNVPAVLYGHGEASVPLAIECPAASVPDKLIVNVNDLHLDQAIHARQVPLPEGARVLDDPELVVVHCIKPHVVEEEPVAAVAEPGAAEPELIRKEKPAEE